ITAAPMARRRLPERTGRKSCTPRAGVMAVPCKPASPPPAAVTSSWAMPTTPTTSAPSIRSSRSSAAAMSWSWATASRLASGRGRAPDLRSFRGGLRHLRFLRLFCPFWLYLVPSAVLGSVGLGLMLWLTPGPQRIGQVEFDLHTMLLGALCVFLGYQTMWLWA